MSEHPSENRKYTAQPMSPTSSGSANADQVVSSCSPRGVAEDHQIHQHPWSGDAYGNHGLRTELARSGKETMKDELKDQRKGNSSNSAWISFSDPVWSPSVPRRSIPTPSIQLERRYEPANASFEEQSHANKLASAKIWLPHLEEGPSYMDQAHDKRGEIARGLLPAVEQDEPSFTDQDKEPPEKHLKTINRSEDCPSPSGKKDTSWPSFPKHVWTCLTPTTLNPSFELAQPVDLVDDSPGFQDHTNLSIPRSERPDFKDQVHSSPGEVSWVVSGFEDQTKVNTRGRKGPDFKDQIQSRPGEMSMRALPVGKKDPNSFDQEQMISTRQTISGHDDETNHQDPSLINAVLVVGNTIVEAVKVTENKTRKTFWCLFIFVLIAAGTLTTLLTLLPKSPPGPTPGPTAAPSMDPNPYSFDLNVLASCYFTYGDPLTPFEGLPCRLWKLPPMEQLESCMYRPLTATFLFNGGGCGQSDNLNVLNFTCNDFNGGPPDSEGEEAFIQVKGNGGSGPIVFEGNVTVGDAFVVSGNDNYDGSFDFLDDDLQISIFTPEHNSSVLQEVNHVSLTCSSPLELLNRYGSLQATGFYNAEQGLVSPFAIFSYAVTLSIKIIIVASDDESSITLAHMTAMTNFAGDLNLTELVNGTTVDHETPHIFSIEGEVDSSSQMNYTFIFEFDGVSNLDGSFCNGTDSSSFLFGISEFDN